MDRRIGAFEGGIGGLLQRRRPTMSSWSPASAGRSPYGTSAAQRSMSTTARMITPFMATGSFVIRALEHCRESSARRFSWTA
jgi:hypothetical protein